MDDTTDPGPDRPSAALAAEAWMSAAGNVLRGLNHGFSNRLSALGAVAAGLGSPDEASMGEQVDGEIGRLEGLLRLYRLLPMAGALPAEPAQVSDAMDDAVGLFRHHYALRDVACTVEGDPMTPPVLVNLTVLTQAVLLLLCAAARHLPADQYADGVVLRYAGDSDWVDLTAETGVAVPLAEGTTSEVAALRWMVRDAAGDASVMRTARGLVRATLRVGTLANLRRRERGG
ncbi:MAG: hypothetical protein HYR75_07315 [Gemmatimonadetes bacterium]|nr:hypothetical protein [Gemmatimonadota bacterium]MBI3568679.1 hypothetical protein [Gemmatimonadota bacterium]